MISLSSKLGLASLGVWLVFAGCGKASDDEVNVAGSSAGAGKAGEPNRTIQIDTGGVGNNPASGVAGAGGVPVPPAIDCGQAGGDSAGVAGANEECAAPPSVCADDRRLAYYSAGVCVAGACTWTVETLLCPGRCSRGSCAPPTTEK